jgi:hydrogenase maturation factor
LGRIKKIEGSSAIVAYKPLEFKNDLYSLGKKKERKVSLRVGKFSFIEKPKINDWVSIHWNLAIQILTRDERRRLEKYTFKNINAINQLNKSFK